MMNETGIQCRVWRSVSFLVAVASVGFCCWFFMNRSGQRKRVLVGDYWVPRLTGWRVEVTERRPRRYHSYSRGKYHDVTLGYGKSVAYSMSFEGTKVSIEFSMETYQETLTPEKLAAGVRAAGRVLALMGPSMRSQVKIVRSEPARFRGHPSYILHTETVDEEKSIMTDSATESFIEGKVVYSITKTLQGKPISEQASKTAEERWRVITNGLTPANRMGRQLR